MKDSDENATTMISPTGTTSRSLALDIAVSGTW